MKSVLFVMSFSGTTMLILHIVVNMIFKNILLAKFNYTLLKFSIVYYLLPICFIKNYYLEFLESIGCENLGMIKKRTYDIDIIKGLKIKDVNFSDTYTILIAILFFLSLIIILMFIHHIITYSILRFRIFKYSSQIEDKKIISILENEKKKLDIDKKIMIRVSTYIYTPMTTGFFQPIILLPSKKLSKKELMYILRHELVHIYNHDYIYKFLGVLVITFHWFNPFAYLLFNRLVTFCEFTCDEFIVKDLTKQQQVEYGCLILEFSENKSNKSLYIPMSSFGGYSKNSMKERISRIKNLKTKKIAGRVIQEIIFISTFVISSLTVLAYNEPLVVYEKENYVNYEDVKVSAYITLEPIKKIKKLPNLDKIEGITYYFIDKENKVSKIGKAKEKFICNHSYENGYYLKHFLYGDSSCKEECYNANKCKHCNDIILETKYNTIIYENCIH